MIVIQHILVLLFIVGVIAEYVKHKNKMKAMEKELQGLKKAMEKNITGRRY